MLFQNPGEWSERIGGGWLVGKGLGLFVLDFFVLLGQAKRTKKNSFLKKIKRTKPPFPTCNPFLSHFTSPIINYQFSPLIPFAKGKKDKNQKVRVLLDRGLTPHPKGLRGPSWLDEGHSR